MRRGSKLFAMIALLVTLTAVFALLLCACTPNEKNKSNENSNENPNKEAELVVSFDEDEEFTLSSIEDLSELLEVKVVSDGVERVVDFTVKSSTLSEDGKNINVVIVAEGIEKTVQLPYVDEVRALIRKELRPLYDILNKEGEKGVALSLTGRGTGIGEISPINAGLNFLADKSVEFALTRGAEEPDVIASYKDGYFTLFGLTLDAEKVLEKLETFGGQLDLPDLQDIAFAGEEDNSGNEDKDEDPVTSAFIAFSNVLDAFDVLSDPSLGGGENIGFVKENGVYRLCLVSKQVMDFLRGLAQKKATFDALECVFAVLEHKTNEALGTNNIWLDITFEIKETGVEVGLLVRNWLSGARYEFALSASVFDHVVQLPEPAGGSEPNDLEFTVPVSFPQKGVELNITTNICLSEIFGEDESKTCATVTVTDKDGDTIASFVLGQNYAYLDASAMSKLFGEEHPFDNAVFYREFESAGEPFLSFLDTLLADLEDLLDEEFEDTSHVDPRFERGYGVSPKEGETLTFDLGATETDLRSRLFAYYLDENGDRVEFSDYRVIGFDASTSYDGDITVEFAPEYVVTLPVLIYDHANVQVGQLTLLGNPWVEKGTTFEQIKTLVAGEQHYTDGTVSWAEPRAGFSIKSVNYPTLDGVVFEQVGSYSVVLTYDLTGADFWTYVQVYDPEHLKVKYIVCSDVNLTSLATEEDIRDQLQVFAVYEDGSQVPVSDYYIIAYTPGCESFVVNYVDPNDRGKTYNRFVRVNHVVDYTDYLRFFYPEPYGNPIDQFPHGFYGAYTLNAALFDQVFSTELSDNGVSLHVTVSGKKDNDLWAILNLFVGIPTEGGFENVDVDTLMDYLAKIKEEDPDMDIAALFKRVVGVELSDFFESLYLDVEVGSDGSMMVSLNDGEGRDYFVTGLSVRPVEATERTPISEEKINAASGFDKLPEFLFEIASRLLGI